MAGPLAGVKVIELAGIGPGPFCGMMLSDMGAEVLRIDRAGSVMASIPDGPRADLLGRGRRSVGVDLKRPEGVETVLRLVERADVLYEGFRPGVTERLGLGPDVCLARNPRLIYGRMTGWGQDGPLAQAAGHDINYIALTGALHSIGRKGEKPVPPLNLVGDFGGGGLILAFGIACALVERDRSGQGQVVDAAMVDGAAALMAIIYGAQQSGWWKDERGVNMLDSGAHFYDTYETLDGKYVSVGSIEPQFYALLVKLAGLEADDLPAQNDRSQWPEMTQRLEAIFKTRTRDEWCEIMEGSDVCFAPVLTLSEAPTHPHAVARDAFKRVSGVTQPGPAPRFSRTTAELDRPPAYPGEHTDEALADWGFSAEDIRGLRDAKALA
jgi:alpha-methylacyl-CoA racemase